MKIVLEGRPKEIAALVREIQEQHVQNDTTGTSYLVQAVKDALNSCGPIKLEFRQLEEK